MPDVNSVKVTCTCGKCFKAPASAVGKRARCPACSAVMVIGAGTAMKSSPAVPAAASSARRTPAVAAASRPVARPQLQPAVATADPFDALDELVRQEETAAPLPDTARCGQCGSPMSQGAVLCTNCGFDTRTGKTLAAATVTKSIKPVAPAKAGGLKKPVIDRMAPTGSFALGLIVSLACAVAASLVWITVAYATHRSFGLIAILIGCAAGVGMQLGHRGYSRIGGITAAALTLVAILLAKLAVLQLILAGMHPPRTMDSLTAAKLGFYFFSPVGLLIMVVGMAAAFRTANGSIRE